MAAYIKCPYCGCNLDNGERCDCQGAVNETINAAATKEAAGAEREP